MGTPQIVTRTARTGRLAARRAVAVAGAACLALGVAGLAAAPASADTDLASVDEGLWYYTRTGVAEAHQQTTGQGMVIASLDGTINPAAPDLVGANLQVAGVCPADDGTIYPATTTDADSEHGTEVAAVIVGTGAGASGRAGVQGVAPGATLLHYSIAPPGWESDTIGGFDCSVAQGGADLAGAIDDAVAAGAKIITTSVAGVWYDEAVDALLRAYAAGVIVLAGAPNEMVAGGSLPDPSGLNGVVAVGRHDINGALQENESMTANGPYLTVLAPGIDIRGPAVVDGVWDRYALADGTSLATPWTAGVLALAWSLHPDATANQMIQALIHTTATTPEGGEPVHDDTHGYGPVSVPRLLAVDPTTFPDENPLLHPLDDPDARPSTAAVLEATGKAVPETAEPTPEPTTVPADTTGDDPADADTDDDTESAGFLLPVILGGAALLLAAAITAAVLLRRRTTTPATATVPAATARPTGEEA